MHIYLHLNSIISNNQHYINRYIKFLATRSKPSGYTESHHILPKSLFPLFANDTDNLIRLTAREHYIAHWLLYKAFPDSYSMLKAFWGMNNNWQNSKTQTRYYRVSSRIYESLRKEVSKEMSVRSSENNPYTQQKIKDKIIEKHGGLGFGSASIKEKHANTMINRFGVDNYFKLPEFIKTIANRNKAQWADPAKKESRIANMKIGLAARPVLHCPHCGLESKSNSNMQRYHFDNCKLLK